MQPVVRKLPLAYAAGAAFLQIDEPPMPKAPADAGALPDVALYRGIDQMASCGC